MSLLLDTDVELSTEPPLHPLAPDSSAFDSFNAFGGDSTRGLLADRLSGGGVPNKPPMPTIDSPEVNCRVIRWVADPGGSDPREIT